DDLLRQLVEPYCNIGAQADCDMRAGRFAQLAAHQIRKTLASLDPMNCANWNINACRGVNDGQCDLLGSLPVRCPLDHTQARTARDATHSGHSVGAVYFVLSWFA